MKKAFALLLVICMIVGFSSVSLAAGAPKFTKYPTSQTTNKKGTVTFTFKAKNYNINESGWHFVNPVTGEDYSGPQMRELLAEYKGTLSVSDGKQTLTLTKVPEIMHGWDVYVVLTNNGYTVNSDRVKLWCYGLAQNDIIPAQATPTETGSVPAQATPSEITATNSNSVTVSAEGLILTPLDTNGNEIPDQAAATLTFQSYGNLVVCSENPVEFWVINGIRIEPKENLTGFTLKNVTTDLTISAKFKEATETTPPEDASTGTETVETVPAETAVPVETETAQAETMPAETAAAESAPAEAVVFVEKEDGTPCQITCTGCVFTYHAGGLKSVSSGTVPSGESIIVIASSGTDVSRGYTINGISGLNAGSANFRLVIKGDAEISIP